jgi:hypothetical protein
MISNIRVIDTKASAKAEVVEMAKLILSRAEAGELVDLTYAVTAVDGSISTGFTSTEDSHRRLSSVSRLLHCLHKLMDDDAD